MEPTLSYVVNASRSIRDDITKKVSLIDLFDGFLLPLAGESNQFFVAAARILNVPPGLAKVDIRLEHPNKPGTYVAEATSSGTLKVGDLDIVNIFSAKINEPGRYYFRVWLNDKKLEDNNRFYISATRPQ